MREVIKSKEGSFVSVMGWQVANGECPRRLFEGLGGSVSTGLDVVDSHSRSIHDWASVAFDQVQERKVVG